MSNPADAAARDCDGARADGTIGSTSFYRRTERELRRRIKYMSWAELRGRHEHARDAGDVGDALLWAAEIDRRAAFVRAYVNGWWD